MRRIFLLLTLSLFSCFAFGQNRKPILREPLPYSRSAEERATRYCKCSHTNRYTIKQRKALFPFSTAKSVKLISFAAPDPSATNGQVNGDTATAASLMKEDSIGLINVIAPNRYAINYRKVKEQKLLTAAGVNQLTDILYNVGYTPVENLPIEIPEPGYKSYQPRNAILFLDASGNATQFIELCFTCQKYYYSSSKTAPVEYCTQKFDLLRRFFRTQDIKYGTAKHFED